MDRYWKVLAEGAEALSSFVQLKCFKKSCSAGRCSRYAAISACLAFLAASAACGGGNQESTGEDEADAGQTVIADAGPTDADDAGPERELCADDPYKTLEDGCPCGTTAVVQGCAVNIDTAAGLLALRDTWNGASAEERAASTHIYILKKDIDLGEVLASEASKNEPQGQLRASWTGIGTREAGFSGVFLGDGHTVRAGDGSGGRLTLVCGAPDCGFFGVVAGGDVEGVTVDVDMTSTLENNMMDDMATAGLAIGLLKDGSAKGVRSKGRLSMAAMNGAAGGLVGYCDHCAVSLRSNYVISHSDNDKSSAEAEVQAPQAMAGGLVGWLLEGGSLTDVSAAGDAVGAVAGGLVARMEGGTIQRARASGAVMSENGTALAAGNGAAGGLVGWMENGRIDQASASGDVLAYGDTQLGTSLGGGFMGKMVLGEVTNAIARGDVAVSQAYWQYAGGFAGEVMAGSIRNAAASGSASTVGAYYSYTGGFLGFLSVLAEGTTSIGGTLSNVAAAGAVEGSVREGSISFVGSNAHQGALLGKLFVSPFDGPAASVSMAYWNAGALEGGSPLDGEDDVQYLTESAPFSASGNSGAMLQMGDGERSLVDTLNANLTSLGDPPEGSKWLTWTQPAAPGEAADLTME